MPGKSLSSSVEKKDEVGIPSLSSILLAVEAAPSKSKQQPGL